MLKGMTTVVKISPCVQSFLNISCSVLVMYMMYLYASVYLGMSFAHGSHDLFTPVFTVNRFDCT